MLRATVLLCLVTSAVLTQSLASTDTVQGTDSINDDTILNNPINDTIVDYPIDDTIDDGSINDMWSAVPKCAADYPRMSVANRKMFQNASPRPHAVCVRADGCFVASVLMANRPFVFMYDMDQEKDFPTQTYPTFYRMCIY